MPITRQQYIDMVEQAKNNPDGTVWHVMETLNDGRQLCLVMGYQEGYDKGEPYQITTKSGEVLTLCEKLAVNIDDLQCDYDVDWYMPWDKKSGEVWDTDTSVWDCTKENEWDFGSEYYLNDAALRIAEGLNNGTLEVH